MRSRTTSIWKTACAAAASILAAACGQEAAQSAAQPEPFATTANASLNPILMQKWARNCALCHVAGEGGAPRIGHADDWAPRIAQGREVLLTNTIEGKANMPPLGYCMSCERDDFIALIEFMAGAEQ